MKRFLLIIFAVGFLAAPSYALFKYGWGIKSTASVVAQIISIPGHANTVSVHNSTGDDVFVDVNRLNTNLFAASTITNLPRIPSGQTFTFDCTGRNSIGKVLYGCLAGETATVYISAF